MVEQSIVTVHSDHSNVKSRFGQLIISPIFLQLAGTVSLYRTKATIVLMKTPTKEKRKAIQMRAIDDIVFSAEMAALDFEPSYTQETFLQLMGLDRFVTRGTWEMLNVSVVREVLTNLNLETKELVRNGKIFPIFGKDWRKTMKAVFFLTPFSAKRENRGLPKLHLQVFF